MNAAHIPEGNAHVHPVFAEVLNAIQARPVVCFPSDPAAQALNRRAYWLWKWRVAMDCVRWQREHGGGRQTAYWLERAAERRLAAAEAGRAMVDGARP